MPEELHIEQLRSSGPQPGEQLQPEEAAAAAGGGAAAPAAAAAPEPDPAIVTQLVTMGFSENGSKRAGEGWCRLTRLVACDACQCWLRNTQHHCI